ncbi:hypothetical protein TCAL_16326 [Tigriopus californicus]|uniref:Uncharacterized protein n=1 Tax=Tigriopus californicus TaxID=6832 RepID=A0A553N8A2_TIGCA|nr:hypothetical protein TCAL_16326 [Tigriopus californicus]
MLLKCTIVCVVLSMSNFFVPILSDNRESHEEDIIQRVEPKDQRAKYVADPDHHEFYQPKNSETARGNRNHWSNDSDPTEMDEEAIDHEEYMRKVAEGPTTSKKSESSTAFTLETLTEEPSKAPPTTSDTIVANSENMVQIPEGKVLFYFPMLESKSGDRLPSVIGVPLASLERGPQSTDMLNNRMSGSSIFNKPKEKTSLNDGSEDLNLGIGGGTQARAHSKINRSVSPRQSSAHAQELVGLERLIGYMGQHFPEGTKRCVGGVILEAWSKEEPQRYLYVGGRTEAKASKEWSVQESGVLVPIACQRHRFDLVENRAYDNGQSMTPALLMRMSILSSEATRASAHSRTDLRDAKSSRLTSTCPPVFSLISAAASSPFSTDRQMMTTSFPFKALELLEPFMGPFIHRMKKKSNNATTKMNKMIPPIIAPANAPPSIMVAL